MTSRTEEKSKILQALIPIVVGIVIALIPRPAGLAPYAWYYFALFVAVIIGVALEVMPMGAVGLTGVAIIGGLNLVNKAPKDTLAWALSGFSNSVVWLVFAAMIFAVALKDTGIGRRIALWLIKKLGKNSLGLGYAITLADLALGPFMPSNTARSFGTMYPIARSTAEALGSHPGETASKIGSFLLFTSFLATFISSSTFLTAAAMSVLATEYISKATGLPPISWISYLYGFIPQAVILIIITPLIAYKFFPPEIKKFPEAPVWASGELEKMGKLSFKEISTLIIFICALIAWIFAHEIIPPAMVAIIAVVLMIVTGVIKWEQVLEEKSAWNILIVLGTLITLANGLKDVGFLDWLAKASTAWVSGLGLSPILIMIILVTIDYLIHYLYVSVTAHVTTLMPLWLAVAKGIPGFPVQLFGIMLIHTKEGFGAMTPYGAGHGVGYMLSGYFPDHKKFWKAETVWSYTYLALMFVSIPYWTWLYGWI
ncbi:MAG: DASS family sodium-coupled anion symporter [Moorella humiferrea]|nr:DASS family sodium-coupled anion symporter [Moorella humiferrea]